MSKLYSMVEANSINNYSAEVLIFAGEKDDRAFAAAKIFLEKENFIKTVILIKYDSFDDSIVHQLFSNTNFLTININPNSDPVAFLSNLQQYNDVFFDNNLIIDITSIRIPEMFMLFKYLQLTGKSKTIQVVYSTPLEYEFQEEPFTSYHSYYGNLKTIDLVGYGGLAIDMSHSQLLIFLGFEGMLSNKVSEDIKYDRLRLVNCMPSIYEKYKDISVINNYDLLSARHEKLSYVPANNPFEVFNFLSENIQNNEPACAAPLSTKPVALGVCLFALKHDNLRVVYPVAEKYESHRSNNVHRTYLYSIDINDYI